MIAIRPAGARGVTRSDALLNRHSFSFGDYHDPAHMGFGPLRVINEITLAPGALIAAQPRANIELLNWVIVGAMRNAAADDDSVLQAGDASCLSAGRGLDEGVANGSDEQTATVLQVWIQPDRVNAVARASRMSVGDRDGVHLIASADGRDGSMPIRQDVSVFAVRLRAGGRAAHALCLGRRAWLQVTVGSLEINGLQVVAGDGAVALHENSIDMVTRSAAELLLFDVSE